MLIRRVKRKIVTLTTILTAAIIAVPAERSTIPAEAASGSYIVRYSANGGIGSMKSQKLKTGTDSTLSANKFSREGYMFRGWSTRPDGTGIPYTDQDTITSTRNGSTVTLYAYWEPQIYMITYEAGGGEGKMSRQTALYDEVGTLQKNAYTNGTLRFAGWTDKEGNHYADQQAFVNLGTGVTSSTKKFVLKPGKTSDKKTNFKSVQGSTVYSKGSHKYAVIAAGLNDSSYYEGDLSHYDTALIKYDLTDAKVVGGIHGLEFDHGNGICYCTADGHFYIAEGGSVAGYPCGIMEVDQDLNYVKEYNPEGLKKAFAIAYYDGYFYVIGRADTEDARNTLLIMDKNMNPVRLIDIDDYYSEGYSSQGIAADADYLYCLSAGFDTYNWKENQRITILTHDGEYVGVCTVDIDEEVEDISIVGGEMYLTTNGGTEADLYLTKLPGVTLTAQWK